MDKIKRMVLGGIAGCMRTTPLVDCEVLLGFPFLDLRIRKMDFKATLRLQSHSSKEKLIDLKVVQKLGIQASVVLDQMGRWLT